MSFAIKLTNSKILKGIVETLAAIVDETQLKATPDRLEVNAMDPERVLLL